MEELEVLIEQNENVIIYGAGSVADLLYAYMVSKDYEKRIKAFIVSNMNGQQNCKHQVLVLNAEDAIKLWESALLIIAVHEKTIKEVNETAIRIGFKNIITAHSETLRSYLYHDLYKSPINNNKIFIMNYHGEGYGCNPKYIAEQLIKFDYSKKLDIVWGTEGDKHTFPDRIRTVQIGTYDYNKELATSKIWIDNVRKTDDVNKRNGQFYIQTWHGSAPFKKVEGDLIGKASDAVIQIGKRDSEMADLFVSGSRFYSALYRSAFWYTGEIIESGLPRQDVFWTNEGVSSRVRKTFNVPQDSMVVLYAPTFRDDRNNSFYNLDIGAVKKTFEDKWGRKCLVWVSKHPLNRSIKYTIDNNMYTDVSGYDDFEEILVAADALITDYSGCIYDFSFSEKPAFLYQPDFLEMKTRRDFYVNPENMPYPQAHTMNDLIRCISEFDQLNYSKKLEKFMNRFGNFDDGKASLRIAEYIMKIINDDIS